MTNNGHIDWKSYSEWRKTKCPKRNLKDPLEQHMELNQSTLEFIGEVAELADLISKFGICNRNSDQGKELIDECGDIFFCGCWLLHAIDQMHILEYVTEFYRPPQKEIDYAQTWSQLCGIQINAGLLANSCKKEIFQFVNQNHDDSGLRVYRIFCQISDILYRTGSSVEEAIKFNKAKLDARFPDGWVPGGGIR